MTDVASATPLIELSGLRKRYQRYEALKGLDLTVPSGTIGLLGPNGAGKSTLMKVLLGLLPFEGQASVLGFDVRRDALALRARVGYMPEREAWLPGVSAVELCSYVGELSGLPPAESMQRAHAALEFVGLGDKRYLRVDRYSTGQKQRVKLAQAVTHDPRLLLLDEPTNGLDPAGRDEMLALIAELPARTGCSVVLSSHLLHDVEQVCEHAVLLHQGEVVYSGTIEELRRGGQRDVYEVRVKERDHDLEAALVERGLRVERDGTLLLVHLPPGDPRPTDALFAAAAAAGVQVRHLAPRQLTLEGAFLRAVSDAAGGASATSPDATASTRAGHAASADAATTEADAATPRAPGRTGRRAREARS